MRPLFRTHKCVAVNVCEQTTLVIPEVTCVGCIVMVYMYRKHLSWVISLGCDIMYRYTYAKTIILMPIYDKYLHTISVWYIINYAAILLLRHHTVFLCLHFPVQGFQIMHIERRETYHKVENNFISKKLKIYFH